MEIKRNEKGRGAGPVRKHSVSKVLEAGKHAVWCIAVKSRV